MAVEEADFKTGVWCRIELMGHLNLAGRVREVTVGGVAMLCVAIPEQPARASRYQYQADEPAIPEHDEYFMASSIYRLTPCTEEYARAAASSFRTDPVGIYLPALGTPSRQLAIGEFDPDPTENDRDPYDDRDDDAA